MNLIKAIFHIFFIIAAGILALYEWLYIRAVNRSRMEVGINPAHILPKLLKMSLYLALIVTFLSTITLTISLLL